MGASREKREEILWDLHQEQEEIKPIELSGEIAPDLFGIEPVKAQEMVSGLCTVFAEREVLKKAYIEVIELPVIAENLNTFKELRLKIVKNRTQGIEKWHKANKAFYLAGGRFVDAIKNKEVLENEQMEAKLLDAEKFFENQEKERLYLLKSQREELLRPFVEFLPNDLENLEHDVFDSFLETKKKAHADKMEADRLEAKRIENENIERQKQIEDQRLDNIRLKKEADAKEKERKIEADKQAIKDAEKDAEIKKERDAREKLEANARAEKLAKEKSESLAIAEAEKLAKAPVKKQLSVWVNSFEIPVSGVENETSKEIIEKFEAFKKWSINQINNL